MAPDGLAAGLPLLGAVATVCLGLLGAVRPAVAADLVGITPDGPLGRAEVRATYGGLFAGLGVACLVLRTPEAFLVLSTGWLGAALVRTLSVGLDGAVSRENAVGIAVEAGIGALLLAGVV